MAEACQGILIAFMAKNAYSVGLRETAEILLYKPTLKRRMA
jgi:hypothetical protein